MKNLIGNLLISPPSLKGTFFQKSVILLTEHHVNGSVGLVLNKPSKTSVNDFAKQNNIMIDQPGVVHIGGPVNVKALTMLHTNDWSCANTMRINKELSISSSPEILTSMAMGFIPENWRIFVGLCGWSRGQLQNEIDGVPPYDRNLSWLTATGNLDIIFDHTLEEQWNSSIDLAGSEFAQRLFE